MQDRAVTADQLLAMPRDGMRRELVRGRLRTMTPPGFEHGSAAQRLAALVGAHVLRHGLGEALGETGFLIAVDPDTVLAPDFAFVQKARVPAAPLRGWFRGAPDLAVEVVSPSDSRSDVDGKAQRWLEAGATIVWVVDPEECTVTAVRSRTDRRVLSAQDDLDAPELLPGFRCKVAALFRALD